MEVCQSKSITDSPRKVNEDLVTIAENSAWVLDGATQLTDTNITPKPTDSRWYVERFNQHLLNSISKEENIEKIIQSTIKKIKREYSRYREKTSQKIEKVDKPSAAGVMTRWNTDKLEYFILGDCTLTLFREGEVTRETTDTRLEKIEEKTKRKIKRLQKEGKDIEETRGNIMPALKDNRRMKNSKKGYWILGTDPRATKKALKGKIDINPEDELYLFSDGLMRLKEKYHEFNSQKELISFIRRKGLQETVKLLREIEKKDPTGSRYPRLRRSDDATAAFIKFR